MNKIKQIFKIGNFCFEIEYPTELEPTNNFKKFLTDYDFPTYQYSIDFVDNIPTFEGRLIAHHSSFFVFQTSTGEARLIGTKGIPGFYAYYQEISDCKANILCQKDRLYPLSLDPGFASILALERRFIKKDGITLHCAYINVGGKAVLFSAASGIGKSTQAGLWEKYRSASIINGDRALLQKRNGTWYAEGYPVCGSSEICHNQDYPIQAIVMLSQSKENSVITLNPIQSFREIYPQIMINHWNTTDTMQAVDLIQDLITNVPIYHLSCTISEDAVRCLENALMNDDK